MSDDSSDYLEEIVHKESIEYTFKVPFFPKTRNSFYLFTFLFTFERPDKIVFEKRFKLMLLHIFNTF